MEFSQEKKNLVHAKNGWINAFLILVACMGLTIAAGAWYSNLTVFLITEFNIKSIHAAQINNIVSGLINIFPFLAAILADSALGNFAVVLASSIVSLLGVVIFTFMVTIKSLRPQPCATNSTTCASPTTFQYSILYSALVLGSIGVGGSRYLIGTMGADQFEKPKQQASFFNLYTVTLYTGFIISYTLLIYIQTNVSWALSFGIALAANVTGVIFFLAGSRRFVKYQPQGSPFASMARVFVAAFRNKKMVEPVDGNEDCYFYESEEYKLTYGTPTKSLRFLNRAALRKRDANQARCRDTKSWSQCTVEEVEDLKKIINIMPLWTSTILSSGVIGANVGFTVLMALVMDRRIGSHFEIPPGTFGVVGYVLTAITSFSLDRFGYKAYKKLTGRTLTHLQGLGFGLICVTLSSVAFALVERRRLQLVTTSSHLMDQPHAVAPFSALWLAFPLVVLGVGEGFSFSPSVALYYQEFPRSLRGTSTAMLSLQIAAGYYLSSAYIGIFGRATSWLPNDINHGRVDYVFWVLAVIAAVNYAYFLLCALLYKYNNSDPESEEKDISVPL